MEKPQMIKSEKDLMEYRVIELNNGLKAILVSDIYNIIDLNHLNYENAEESSSDSGQSFKEAWSDTDSEKGSENSKLLQKKSEEKLAACALCVGVGSFSDPPDIPGLAHFLEHMVFMGSKKYPQENGFDEFIKKYGGSDNGSTDCETTSFYFECSEKYLREGLDRFAQFFISPLLVPEAMAREREILHSEFEMSLPSDGTRRDQILGSLALPGHPASKFLWGNLKTLKDNVDDITLHKRVQEFQKRHYSAHRMTVAIQGRLSLDTLEEYIRKSFSAVPSNNLPSENFSAYIGCFGADDNFNKIIWVKPIKDICQVHLTWVLPSYLKEYKSRPLEYVAWLIGHEGKGSLLSFLRKKVWALQCEAGNDESGFEHNSIYSLFSVSLTLTEDGYQFLEEVIALVFNYVSLLLKTCPNKAIYDELREICEINFRYKTEVPSATYVEILAESMQIYEPEHYLAGGELYLEYRPELIQEVLNHLTPDRVNIIVYSKEKQAEFYDRTEPWFDTKYKVEDIPKEWKRRWSQCSPHAEFHTPLPNPYIGSDFSLLPLPDFNSPYPLKVVDDDLLEVWYRQDVKFAQPLAFYSFYLISPILKAVPENAVLLDILSTYLDIEFTEESFLANQAGLNCVISTEDLGLSLQFSGYNEKLSLFFEEILKLMEKFTSQKVEEEGRNGKNYEILFDAIKREKSRCYYNNFLRPGNLVKMARLSILMENHETSVEHLAIINNLTYEMLVEFSRRLFRGIRILGLIQGNISKEKTLEICGKFESILRCSPLEGPKPQVLITKLREGETYLRLASFNKSDNNSVITNYYQIGPGNIKTSCLIDLLMMIMDEPLFDNLRTKQQIGYDVRCSSRDTYGILGFSITVFFQSTKFDADDVDRSIEQFLQDLLKKIKTMPKREWQETKSSLCLLKNVADLQLHDEVKRNFAEICSKECLFDRMKKEAETVPGISIKELCTWFEDHIASGKNFRKLSVQVLGKGFFSAPQNLEQVDINEKTFNLNVMRSENEKKDLFIADVVAFKNSRQFYPVRSVIDC